MENNKIFDNYEVDCNTCESYWNSQCDGVKVNDRRNCTSYKATRNVDVVEEVANMKTTIERLDKWLLITNLVLLLTTIRVVFA